MKIREEFVLRALEPNVNMTELCLEYGISRKTGYKWRERFGQRGGHSKAGPHLAGQTSAPARLVSEVLRTESAARRAAMSYVESSTNGPGGGNAPTGNSTVRSFQEG